jgi:hypothetical protein
MKLIATQTVTTAQPNITFSDIPQNFTDLHVLYSLRATADTDTYEIKLNTSSANFSHRFLRGEVGSVGTDGRTDNDFVTSVTKSVFTANTFSNGSLYFPNYTSSNFKSISEDTVLENNATDGRQKIAAALWSNTSAINAVELTVLTGNFAVGSTISLYGIGGAGDGWAPKATGGVISKIDGYYVHTFTASGTFTPTTNLSNVDYLVVAGGAGTGAGGGGAGGYRSSVTGESSGGGASAEAKLSLASGTAYTVTIGAGGANETNGGNTTFGSITSLGGGHGRNNSLGGNSSGGSGGGAGGGVFGTGAIGTTGQGYAGGNGGQAFPNDNGGGGGGAGAVGSAGASGNGGAGGAGVASSITGSSVTRAGGGGGQSRNNVIASGGAGGGGNGGNAGGGPIGGTSGLANTGGGAGGGYDTVANGGSGIVVVRYLA